MSDQATPDNETDNGAAKAPSPVRIDATEVAFPWVWALVGVVAVVLAVAIAVVTESQGIGLR